MDYQKLVKNVLTGIISGVKDAQKIAPEYGASVNYTKDISTNVNFIIDDDETNAHISFDILIRLPVQGESPE